MAKKHTPKKVTFVLLAFVIVGFLFFLANITSRLEKALLIPNNQGFTDIETVNNFICLVTQDSKMYLFDWNQLDKAPQMYNLLSEEAVILDTGEVFNVWGDRHLKMNGFYYNTDRQRKMDLDMEADNYWIKTGSGRNHPVILTQRYGDPTEYAFYFLNPASLAHRFLFSLEIDSSRDKLKDYEISNQEHMLAVFGRRDQKAWLLLYDLNQEKILWEKFYEDFRVIPYAVFSKEDKSLFLRDGFSQLHQVDVESGQILRGYSIGRKNPNTEDATSVQDMKISPDGNLVAALVHSAVYVWDIQTSRLVMRFTPEHKIESGLCFSPDGKFLATADLRQGGPVKIWKIPAR